MMMTNPMRLSVISALDEGLAYSHSDYFAPLLMQGISAVDIGLIELVTTILRSEPYLNEADLLERGVSQKQIQRTLGGFDNFKQLLKIDDYCFSDLLRDNNWDISNGITLSYFQYQKFYQDIRRDYIQGHIADMHPNLSVLLNDDYSIHSVPITRSHYATIPATDAEAAAVSFALLFRDYEFIEYDESKSLLTLQAHRRDKAAVIEVRCLASQFSQNTAAGICVVDDAQAMTKLRNQKKILDFKTLIERNTRNTRIPT
ncbi:hypothetical protein NB464_03205 [Vibrio diabolicus]|uniref:hypothetical protein n=1 Tax=Vibrio diabolicus TaxID=50719 RepID=UPI00215C9017|nr:hypothetical protein [Vibrio diabolicus]MCR9303084.1 hypothetical protein [Vibrio diabolicus]MCR9424619.1 hypothetical protein [Vibrio diabolicus]